MHYHTIPIHHDHNKPQLIILQGIYDSFQLAFSSLPSTQNQFQFNNALFILQKSEWVLSQCDPANPSSHTEKWDYTIGVENKQEKEAWLNNSYTEH